MSALQQHRKRLKRLGLVGVAADLSMYPYEECTKAFVGSEERLDKFARIMRIDGAAECTGKDKEEKRQCICSAVADQISTYNLERDLDMSVSTLSARRVQPGERCVSLRGGPSSSDLLQSAKDLRLQTPEKKRRNVLCEEIQNRLIQVASLAESQRQQVEKARQAQVARRVLLSSSSSSSSSEAERDLSRMSAAERTQYTGLQECAKEMHRLIVEQLQVPAAILKPLQAEYNGILTQKSASLAQWKSLNAKLKKVVDDVNAALRRQALPRFLRNQLTALDNYFSDNAQRGVRFRLPPIDERDVPSEDLLGYLKRAARGQATRDDWKSEQVDSLFAFIRDEKTGASVPDDASRAFCDLMQLLHQDPQNFVQFTPEGVSVSPLGKLAVRTGTATINTSPSNAVLESAANDVDFRRMRAHVAGKALATPYLSFAGTGGIYGVLPVAVHLWRNLEQARRQGAKSVTSYVVSLDRGEGFYAPAVAATMPSNNIRRLADGSIQIKSMPTMLQNFAASDDEYLCIRSLPAQSVLRVLRFRLLPDGSVSTKIAAIDDKNIAALQRLPPAIAFDTCVHAKLFNIYDVIVDQYYAMRQRSPQRFQKFLSAQKAIDANGQPLAASAEESDDSDDSD